eukprot:2717922-Alexandrium_andersonii.AAC.1
MYLFRGSSAQQLYRPPEAVLLASVGNVMKKPAAKATAKAKESVATAAAKAKEPEVRGRSARQVAEAGFDGQGNELPRDDNRSGIRSKSMCSRSA